MSEQPPTKSDKTDVTRWLPEWMLDDKKQRAVAFVGAGLAAIVTAIWAVSHTPRPAPNVISLEVKDVDASTPYSIREQDVRYTVFIRFIYEQRGNEHANCEGEIRTKVSNKAESALSPKDLTDYGNGPSMQLADEGRWTAGGFRFYLWTAEYTKEANFRLTCDNRTVSSWAPVVIPEIVVKPELAPLVRSRH
jgi:hypothetical protein